MLFQKKTTSLKSNDIDKACWSGCDPKYKSEFQKLGCVSIHATKVAEPFGWHRLLNCSQGAVSEEVTHSRRKNWD